MLVLTEQLKEEIGTAPHANSACLSYLASVFDAGKRIRDGVLLKDSFELGRDEFW